MRDTADAASASDGWSPQGFFRYWGKAGDSGRPEHFHPLALHSLDVAAVGVSLSEARPAWIEAFAATAQVERAGLESAIAFLLALHDLGKFGDGFQNLRGDVARHLGRAPSLQANRPRHDTLGYLLWSEWADPGGAHHAPVVRLDLTDADGARQGDRLAKKVLLPWIAAVTGHHGRPPSLEQYPLATLRDRLGLGRRGGAWEDALAFVEAVRTTLEPPIIARRRGAPPMDEDSLKASSWWLAGYATLCDWVGSNTDWFPYEPRTTDLRTYWNIARRRAEVAVRAAGLGAPRIRPFGGFHQLFAENGRITESSPLQTRASMVALGEGPQLFLLEDLTGSGKTEAALTLVGRLLDAGRADGFYFALPTMATANSMFDRVRPVIDRLFEPEPAPSFLLAHSGPNLRSRGTGFGAEALERQRGSTYGPGEATASGTARSWLGDSRKKALLADAGVGTIDQALVGALQARHGSLRLLGLHHHVLVVDEVHACDEYMNGILMELLRLQAALGGSAVLLSATLPISTRIGLVDAFRKGLGAPGCSVEGTAYPVLVRADRSGAEVLPVASRVESGRRVQVAFMESVDEVVGWCRGQVEKCRSVAWIRNTVRDAVDAFDRLVDVLGPDRVQLFHARFPMGDRLEIEQDVVRRFGPDGGPGQREGHIVVSTQVMEQSLDIDFDDMVSDLAPVDRLIQRAGRLQRHARGERGVPALHVLAPAWEDPPADGWPGAAFKGTVAVYGRLTTLWRTQWILRKCGRIDLPDSARDLVEAVYGSDDGHVPDSLRMDRRELNREGEELRDRAMSQHNRIRIEQGYLRTGFDWADDEFVPTRLGDPTVTLRLVRSGGATVVPWSGASDVTEGVRWRLGEVTVRANQVRSGRPDEEERLRGRLRELGAEPPEHVVPIEMRPVGVTWEGQGLAHREIPVTIVFTPGRGLEFRTNRGS